MKISEELEKIGSQIWELELKAFKLVEKFGDEKISEDAESGWHHLIWKAFWGNIGLPNNETYAETLSAIGKIEEKKI